MCQPLIVCHTHSWHSVNSSSVGDGSSGHFRFVKVIQLLAQVICNPASIRTARVPQLQRKPSTCESTLYLKDSQGFPV